MNRVMELLVATNNAITALEGVRASFCRFADDPVMRLGRLLSQTPGLAEFSVSDGSGGGEPDYIWLGHDEHGTTRCVEIAEYQGDDCLAFLQRTIEIAQLMPEILEYFSHRESAI